MESVQILKLLNWTAGLQVSIENFFNFEVIDSRLVLTLMDNARICECSGWVTVFRDRKIARVPHD